MTCVVDKLPVAFIPTLTVTATGNVEKCITSIAEWYGRDGRRWRKTWYTDGTCKVEQCNAGTLTSAVAFTIAEVESAKAHGSAAYESMAADVAMVKELARMAWVRTLPLHVEGETLSDYAARAGILPPKPGKREQWADAVLAAACDRLAIEYDR